MVAGGRVERSAGARPRGRARQAPARPRAWRSASAPAGAIAGLRSHRAARAAGCRLELTVTRAAMATAPQLSTVTARGPASPAPRPGGGPARGGGRRGTTDGSAATAAGPARRGEDVARRRGAAARNRSRSTPRPAAPGRRCPRRRARRASTSSPPTCSALRPWAKRAARPIARVARGVGGGLVGSGVRGAGTGHRLADLGRAGSSNTPAARSASPPGSRPRPATRGAGARCRPGRDRAGKASTSRRGQRRAGPRRSNPRRLVRRHWSNALHAPEVEVGRDIGEVRGAARARTQRCRQAPLAGQDAREQRSAVDIPAISARVRSGTMGASSARPPLDPVRRRRRQRRLLRAPVLPTISGVPAHGLRRRDRLRQPPMSPASGSAPEATSERVPRRATSPSRRRNPARRRAGVLRRRRGGRRRGAPRARGLARVPPQLLRRASCATPTATTSRPFCRPRVTG